MKLKETTSTMTDTTMRAAVRAERDAACGAVLLSLSAGAAGAAEPGTGGAIARAVKAVEAAAAKVAGDPTRPVFHFRPPPQWMNDVCGAFHHEGWHHIFFQFHPFSDQWGRGVGWGHARSRDLLHWESLPPALLPDENNSSVMDASGSAAFDADGTPVLFFARTPDKGKRQQWAALPDDKDLIRWRRVDIGLAPGKSGVPEDISPSWADMFVFRAGNRTFAVFKSSGGLVCEAQKPDLLAWKAVGRVEGVGGECPNLFPLEDQHVLIRSTHPISYRIGRFDAEKIALLASMPPDSTRGRRECSTHGLSGRAIPRHFGLTGKRWRVNSIERSKR